MRTPRTSIGEPSDEQLMQAYDAGDMAAFDALYARHEGTLFRFVKRVLGGAQTAQADDVFQDCWLRIVNGRAGFSPERGRWKTWAYTIAHNLAMDRLRTSGREVGLGVLTAYNETTQADDADALDWLQASLDDSHPSTDDLAHWRAAGRQLLHCLDELPALQRAAFLLHHEEGASVLELAQALGLEFETAKSRLRYALQKLRGCMQAYLSGWEAA